MKTWKRNAVIAGVLVLVCAGIYLNWLYGGNTPELTDTLDADKIMGESTLVLGNEQDSDAQLVNKDDTQTASFAQMRLARQTARDEAVTILQETIAYAGGDETQASSKELESLISDALTESQIESLVVAKGYADCVAYINEEGISLAVAVPAEGMSQEDVSLLADIVMSQTDFELSDIRVIGVE